MASQKIIRQLFPAFLAVLTFACASSNTADVKFRYDMMLQKAYGELGEGRILPVTIEKATEIDGAVTGNGQFLFFASDRDRGNFDIYLRSLSDITTARLTSHPSRDFSPAVSPDGKYCSFVSQREDPQGDVYVMSIDAADLIKKAASGSDVSADDDAVNITALTDPVSRAPMTVKDADPAWSPDGKLIAFSSLRDNTEEIYICTRKGKDIRRISTKGGIHPSFSRDGSKILFVSYRDNPQGDVYSADVAGGKETRLTAAAGIKLYPSSGASYDEFYYTLIDRDTNGDGTLDFKDRSVLMFENSAQKKSFPLTLYGSSSFRGRWFPVFPLKYANSQEDNFRGVLFYSEQDGNNININVIPEYGIIPKRKSAEDQYDFAETLQTEDADRERYILALMRVYYFYGSRTDAESVTAVTRGLLRAAAEYRSGGNAEKAAALIKTAASLSKKSGDYPDVAADAYARIVAGKDASAVYESGIAASGAKNPYLVYLLDDAASYFRMKGDTAKAVVYYSRIAKEFPAYRRLSYVNMALAQLTFDSMKTEISSYYLEVMRKGKPFQKDKASLDLVRFFNKETDPRKRIGLAQNMYPQFEKKDADKKEQGDAAAKSSKADSNILAVLDFVTGESYVKAGNIRSAEEHLAKALGRLKTTEILYYDVNLQLADIAMRQGDPVKEEKYLAAAANSYLNRWNRADYTAVLSRLIEQYENRGASYEYAGDYKKASELYAKYVKLVTYLHWLKKYEDLYNEYGARAHVLYVDAYSNSGSDMIALCKELEAQYSGDKLDLARMNFDKAHIYGLSYIYAKTAIEYGRLAGGLRLDISERSVIDMLQKSMTQIDWALFMDDAFSDPYLLQGWLNQFIDMRRGELAAADKGMDLSRYNDAFPSYLWEKNKAVYQKAIDANDEARFPDKEGSLHLNLANTHFLLMNYPAALEEYRLASEFKKNFGSKKEEALFRYHLGYCCWQNGDIAKARAEMGRVIDIYRSMSGSGSVNRNAEQMMIVYRYLALFDRTEKNYEKALSWYALLIEESRRSKVVIDITRTWLDMAYCYEQLGDDGRAASYCAKAEDALKKADSDDPAFKMQFRLFGLFSFQFYDLGPDYVVIGDSRCFSGLTVVQKRYLALSTLERIAVKRGEYERAQEYIAQKIKIAKERSTSADVEVRIRALNNAGYCSFMTMKYDDARSRFEEALAVATKAENSNGIFASIMNLVDLYAYAVENELPLVNGKVKDLDALKSKITAFRSEYEKTEFEKRKKDIEAVAEGKKENVKEEDLDAARKAVAAEATDKYLQLDIAAATIDFYRAEYIAGNINGGTDPYAAYSRQDALFATYKNAGKVFDEAADRQPGNASRMKAKLWMNAASCSMRTGFAEKAYEFLGRAETKAADTARDDILWDIYYREALLMRDAGKQLDDDYLRIAERYFESSCAVVEKHPASLSPYAGRIAGMYDAYTGLLVRKGDFQKALCVIERRYAVQRVISVALAMPAFSADRTQSLYEKYLALDSAFTGAQKTRSALLDTGVSAEDPAAVKVAAAVKKSEDEIIRLRDAMKQSEPLLYSQLFVPAVQSVEGSVPKNASVFVFFSENDIIYAWRVTSEKTATAAFSGDGAAAYKAAAAFVKGNADTQQRFIVMNDAAAALFAETRADMPACMFIPSVERARHYAGASGIAGSGSVKTAPAISDDLRPYDVIVDAGNSGLIKKLYKGGARPSLVIAPFEGVRRAGELMEALLWTGGSAVFVKGDIPVKTKGDLLQWKGALSSLNTAGKDLFASGHDALITDDQAALAARKAEYEKRLTSAVSGGNADEALNFYYRMKDVSSDADIKNTAYLYARILELSGMDAAALDQARIAAEGGTAECVSYAVYLMLKTGRTAEAAALSVSSDAVLAGSADAALFKNILSRLKTGTISEIPMPQGRFILPADKLILLLQRYALLAGTTVSASSGNFAELSSADMLISMYCGGKVMPRGMRADETAELFRSADRRSVPDRALALAENAGGYDAFSLYPVFAALNAFDALSVNERLAFIQNLDPYAVSLKAGKLDRLMVLTRFADAALAVNAGEKFIAAADCIIDDTRDGSAPWLYNKTVIKKARYLASVSRYKDVQLLLSGVNQDDVKAAGIEPAYILLLAETSIFGGDSKNGRDILAKGNFTNPGDIVTRDLLYAHAERMQIIAKPAYAAQGMPEYEKYMKEAVKRITPALITGPDAPRSDLLDSGIDFLISFSLKKNNNVWAILFAELRNQIAYWRAFPSADFSLSAEAAAAFKQAVALNDPLSYAQAVSRYPEIARAERIPFMPLTAFQKKIPSGSCVLYIIRNEHDLFAWIIERESLQSVRIPGGYDEAARLCSLYGESVKNLTPVSSVSAGLDALLSPLLKQTGGKKLYIITDGYTEKIPFEITGTGQVLAAKTQMLYMPSIMGAFASYPEADISCDIIGSSRLDDAAVRESGIARGNKLGGIVHVVRPVSVVRGNLSDAETGNSISAQVKGKSLLWVNGPLPAESASLFAMQVASASVGAVAVNMPELRDVNSQYFASQFYERMKAGDTAGEAFSVTERKISSHRKYFHPAFWAGIRLYTNGFQD